MEFYRELEEYILKAKSLPFFYVTGGARYKEVLRELNQRGFNTVRASDFCPSEDKFPNMDRIIEELLTSDVNCKDNKTVFLGLGEYLALRGEKEAENGLRKLNKNINTARIVLLLRCVSNQLKNIAVDSSILKRKNLVFFENDVTSNLSVTLIKQNVANNVFDIVKSEKNEKTAKGIKALLRLLEDNSEGDFFVNTSLLLSSSLIQTKNIQTSYSALESFGLLKISQSQNVSLNNESAVKEKLGSEEQWNRLLFEVNKAGSIFQKSKSANLNAVFLKKGFVQKDGEISSITADSLKENLFEADDFGKWLYFLFLKCSVSKIKNGYLRYVVSITDSCEKLKDNVLRALIHVNKNDERFDSFYDERKKLLKGFAESETAAFINENKIDYEESFYRLTDNTSSERQEIIKYICARKTVPSETKRFYPALFSYAEKYVFDCGSLSKELTEYFEEYKKQKLFGEINGDFLLKVEQNARKRPFLRLESRENVFCDIGEKESAFLYWIDALGLEYMAYISSLAKQKGLEMSVKITRANLPTITSANHSFFDDWKGAKEKESELDEIKHKDSGGFRFNPDESSENEEKDAPVHLEAELKVIERALEKAAFFLKSGKYKSFVIASDHGASRLAVIHRQEEKYETDTKGEHSGRCCKEFPIEDLARELPFATKENGFFVLGDYGRFKKSRAANVEVHGGATLEEVAVPVIILKNAGRSDGVRVEVINKDSIKAGKNGTSFTIYVSLVKDKISVKFPEEEKAAEQKGKSYPAIIEQTSKDNYKITLPSEKRSKKNLLTRIFDGNTKIAEFKLNIKPARSMIKDDFDF